MAIGTMYWFLRGKQVQAATKRAGGPISSGFPGAEKAVPRFSSPDLSSPMGFTLYYKGGAGQLAVLEVKRSVERGSRIIVVAKDISDMAARDFVLAGAVVNLIDFNTRLARVFNLISDGIRVYSIFQGRASYSQILDLRNEERKAAERGGKGSLAIHVVGDFSYWERKDILAAGGCPVDRKKLKQYGSSSQILSYAFGRQI